jgi:hypothetical protein
VTVPGQPSAVLVHKGQRLVLGVSGGAVELEPDQHHPAITVSDGSVELPVVSGQLRFAS